MIRDNNYKYDGINLFFAKLLHILFLILASSKLGKARERTRWNEVQTTVHWKPRGVLLATQCVLSRQLLVSTCLLGISMWLFNRHFRIKWPTHNFDFLTCPCLVFLYSVNGLTIWPVSQTKSLTFTLPFFLSPPTSNLSSGTHMLFYGYKLRIILSFWWIDFFLALWNISPMSSNAFFLKVISVWY